MSKFLKSLWICLIIVIFALASAIFASWISNGYESLSVLYLKCNGKVVSNEISVPEGNLTIFKVKSVKFTKIKNYTVQIVPNAEYDFVYSADNAKHKFSNIEDFSQAFSVQKQEGSFTLIADSMQHLLSRYHNGAEIVIDSEIDYKINYFKLIVKSNNGQFTISVELNCFVPLVGIVIEDLVFG